MDQWIELIRSTMRSDPGIEATPQVLYVRVSFDNDRVMLHRRKQGGAEAFRTQFTWPSILRNCFKDYGPMASDVVYVISTDSEHVLAIPLEAEGGNFWRALPQYGVFPPGLHERASCSMDGSLYCWPPLVRAATPGPSSPRR